VDSGRFDLLIVDDNPGDIRLAREQLREAGLEAGVREARDGLEAIEHLRGGGDLPDLILTDLQMPRLDGLQLVEAVRREFPAVPIVLMTAFGSEAIAFRSLQAGAASYVPKTMLREALPGTLRQLLDLARARRQDERLQRRLVASESAYLLDNEIDLVAPLAGLLAATCRRLMTIDETEQFRLTIALHEALSNGIVHGNLEVSSSLRRDAGSEEAFHRLIARRRAQPAFRDRRIHLLARVTPDAASFVVRDEGRGFNPTLLPDPRDPSNLETIGGRGLLLIRTFMDEVRHNDAGNEITMIKRGARQGAADPHSGPGQTP
jgi:CheY-like chemotaxis protein